MRKNILRIIISSMLILTILAACNEVPTEQATPETQKKVISSQNVTQLAPAFQASEADTLNDLVWASDSSALIAISGSEAIRYSADTFEKQETFSYDNPAALYAASPDGKTIAFSEDSYNIFLVDIEVTSNASTIYSPAMLGTLDFSPDGKTLLSTSMDDIAVTLWDAASGAQLQTITGFETAAPVYSAKFGEDGKHIIWFARATVQLYDIASQEFGPEMSHEDFVVDEALTKDGSLVATAAAGTINGEFLPVIYLWDAASGELKATLTYPEAFNAIAFSPDGSLIAASSGSKLIFWNVADGQQIAEIAGGDEDIFDLTFSPDGISLATSGANGTITLWQVK
jgi:WD40 repeat protein